MTNEELVLAIQAGHDVTENMEQLYNQNRGMIIKLTEKYKGIEELQDLRQEAYFGLVRAVELWNPERDAQFLTFMIICVKTVLNQYISDCGALIRIPASQKTLLYKYDKYMSSFRMELGRDATEDELQVMLGISKTQLDQLKKDRLALRIRSTSDVIGGEDDDVLLEDILPAEGDQYEDVIEKVQHEQLSRELWGAVDQLPEREAEVIRSRFQGNRTLKQCGDHLGISPERCRQLQDRGLRALRSPKVTKRLLPYLTEGYICQVGYSSGINVFKRYGSVEERIIMSLERHSGPIWKNKLADIGEMVEQMRRTVT